MHQAEGEGERDSEQGRAPGPPEQREVTAAEESEAEQRQPPLRAVPERRERRGEPQRRACTNFTCLSSVRLKVQIQIAISNRKILY